MKTLDSCHLKAILTMVACHASLFSNSISTFQMS